MGAREIRGELASGRAAEQMEWKWINVAPQAFRRRDSSNGSPTLLRRGPCPRGAPALLQPRHGPQQSTSRAKSTSHASFRPFPH